MPNIQSINGVFVSLDYNLISYSNNFRLKSTSWIQISVNYLTTYELIRIKSFEHLIDSKTSQNLLPGDNVLVNGHPFRFNLAHEVLTSALITQVYRQNLLH